MDKIVKEKMGLTFLKQENNTTRQVLEAEDAEDS